MRGLRHGRCMRASAGVVGVGVMDTGAFQGGLATFVRWLMACHVLLVHEFFCIVVVEIIYPVLLVLLFDL